MWFTFKAGSVRVISLNSDVCGYSQGAQKASLERTLRDARDDDDIDWIVVCMR
jgi:hypothetical protein